MFKRVAMIHDRSGNTVGLTICMQILVQTCLVEFHTKGDIQRSHMSIFRFFTETNFLKNDWSKVKLHLSTLRQELKNLSNENIDFKVNLKEFS